MGPGSYGRAVPIGYPLLQRRGSELREAGVRFHDLTMMFKDVEEPVYSDSCCHLNEADMPWSRGRSVKP